MPCDEGYTPVFGGLCVKTTTLKKVYNPKTPPAVHPYTSPACEAALSALGSASSAMDAALAVPKKLFAQARRLLGYPTELAQQAISAATAALADASRAIDDLLDVGGDLRRALEAVLDCPLLADSDLGKEVADILDTLDMGGDVTSQVRELSRQFSSGASEALDAALESPTAQLANMSKVYDEALQRGGINELVNKVRELRKCVDDLCRGYEMADRLPKSADAMLAEIGAKVDETSGEVMASLANAADETQQAGREALEEFRALAETVRSE